MSSKDPRCDEQVPRYHNLSRRSNRPACKDDRVGPRVARHGLSASEYQAEFDAQVKAGRYPTFVQGGGPGNDIACTAVLASQDQPMARERTVTGTAVPAQAGIDSAMETSQT